MLKLNTMMLSQERQDDVLNRLKIEFQGKIIDNHSFTTKLLRKCVFRKLMKSSTLLEYMQERKRLHDEGIFLGTLEEELTVPFVGLTKDELYTMGLDNKKVDDCYRVNYEEVFIMPTILGKETYERLHSYRNKVNEPQTRY